jgi:hypothetical protein
MWPEIIRTWRLYPPSLGPLVQLSLRRIMRRKALSTLSFHSTYMRISGTPFLFHPRRHTSQRAWINLIDAKRVTEAELCVDFPSHHFGVDLRLRSDADFLCSGQCVCPAPTEPGGGDSQVPQYSHRPALLLTSNWRSEMPCPRVQSAAFL